MLLSKVRVIGNSMEPTLKHNQIIIASSIPFLFKKPRIGDIVVVKHDRCIIKRIGGIKKDQLFVVGDNRNESTDSRNFGWVNKNEIIGKLILRI